MEKTKTQILLYLKSHNKNYTNKQYNFIEALYDEQIQENNKKAKNEILKNNILNFDNLYNIIIKNESDGLFSLFDNLYNISNADFKKLYNSAKRLYNKYFYNNNFINENCFISSSSLHGFYFPNLQNINCIAFINKKPVLILESEADQ